MKKILCTSIVLMILLTACTDPMRQPSTGEKYTYGVYELNFSVEYLSGWPFERWDFIYTYGDKEIKSGHQVLLSLEIFTFYSVQVEMIERDNPKNSFTATFPVAICDGGFGKTEITVTGSNGKTTTYKITCNVKQVGKR